MAQRPTITPFDNRPFDNQRTAAIGKITDATVGAIATAGPKIKANMAKNKQIKDVLATESEHWDTSYEYYNPEAVQEQDLLAKATAEADATPDLVPDRFETETQSVQGQILNSKGERVQPTVEPSRPSMKRVGRTLQSEKPKSVGITMKGKSKFIRGDAAATIENPPTPGADNNKIQKEKFLSNLENSLRDKSIEEIKLYKSGRSNYVMKVNAFKQKVGMKAVPWVNPSVEEYIADPTGANTAGVHIDNFMKEGKVDYYSQLATDYMNTTEYKDALKAHNSNSQNMSAEQQELLTVTGFKRWAIKTNGVPSTALDVDGAVIEADEAKGIWGGKMVGDLSTAEGHEMLSHSFETAKGVRDREFSKYKEGQVDTRHQEGIDATAEQGRLNRESRENIASANSKAAAAKAKAEKNPRTLENYTSTLGKVSTRLNKWIDQKEGIIQKISTLEKEASHKDTTPGRQTEIQNTVKRLQSNLKNDINPKLLTEQQNEATLSALWELDPSQHPGLLDADLYTEANIKALAKEIYETPNNDGPNTLAYKAGELIPSIKAQRETKRQLGEQERQEAIASNTGAEALEGFREGVSRSLTGTSSEPGLGPVSAPPSVDVQPVPRTEVPAAPAAPTPVGRRVVGESPSSGDSSLAPADTPKPGRAIRVGNKTVRSKGEFSDINQWVKAIRAGELKEGDWSIVAGKPRQVKLKKKQ
jgi:hypothetical protein